jgi:hypothetical protein
MVAIASLPASMVILQLKLSRVAHIGRDAT